MCCLEGPPGKSQVVIGFFMKSGTDPLRKQLDPWGPIASRGGCVRPFVKYVDDVKKIVVRTLPR